MMYLQNRYTIQHKCHSAIYVILFLLMLFVLCFIQTRIMSTGEYMLWDMLKTHISRECRSTSIVQLNRTQTTPMSIIMYINMFPCGILCSFSTWNNLFLTGLNNRNINFNVRIIIFYLRLMILTFFVRQQCNLLPKRVHLIVTHLYHVCIFGHKLHIPCQNTNLDSILKYLPQVRVISTIIVFELPIVYQMTDEVLFVRLNLFRPRTK